MSSYIYSVLKRLFVKYGTSKDVARFAVMSVFLLCVFTVVSENKYGLATSFQYSDYGTVDESEYDIKLPNVTNKLGIIGCDPSIPSTCLEKRRQNQNIVAKNKKKAHKLPPKKWISKFKPSKQKHIADIPQRVIGDDKVPINSVYSEDQIVQNLTWTMAKHIARRKVFGKRKNTVARHCQQRSNEYLQNLAFTWDLLRWTPKYHILWCPVFKAASTTWMKNFLLIAGEKDIVGSLHNRVRELFSSPKGRSSRNLITKNSLKMLIVRHPFERLLSAYRDKMLRELKSDDPYRKMQKDILKRYYNCNAQTYNASDFNACANRTVEASTMLPKLDTISEDNEVEILLSKIVKNIKIEHPSFLQFLLQVRDELENYIIKRSYTYVDQHWMPISQSCSPCFFKYDIIAHVETLAEDQEYIIRETGLENLLINSHTHASRFDNFNDTKTSIYNYYKDIPVSLLKNLYHLYRADFQIFDYSPDEFYKIALNI